MATTNDPVRINISIKHFEKERRPSAAITERELDVVERTMDETLILNEKKKRPERAAEPEKLSQKTKKRKKKKQCARDLFVGCDTYKLNYYY